MFAIRTPSQLHFFFHVLVVTTFSINYLARGKTQKLQSYDKNNLLTLSLVRIG